MAGKNNRYTPKKNNIFSRLTNYDKDGKGVKKRKITDKERYSLKSFFIAYKSHFWNLITLNLMFMLMISPIICGILSFLGVFSTRMATPSNILFAPIYGAQVCSGGNPVMSSLLGIFGTQNAVLLGNPVTNTLNIIALLAIFTFGMANVGMTYILRGYTRGDYIMLWHDFFKAVKKNLVGSIIMGICDIAMIILLAYSAFYYSSMQSLLYFVMFAMCFVYFLMRFYIYILLITFKLSPVKLVKNAFILAVLGIKRNLMAFVGIGVFALICYMLLSFAVQFGIILPFFLAISNTSFMACFAAYPNIKKYMIDPYNADHPDGGDDYKIEEEPIFIDRG
ncbi:MAG: DUF624 domain-containing protein [Oscillospiraceae bacterium]|nr:DUF624 domain-containing protein [Oscillospiraceae bacterium]